MAFRRSAFCPNAPFYRALPGDYLEKTDARLPPALEGSLFLGHIPQALCQRGFAPSGLPHEDFGIVCSHRAVYLSWPELEGGWNERVVRGHSEPI